MKKIAMFAVSLSLLVVACSGSSDTHCVDPAGLYAYHYDQHRNGTGVYDCDAIADYSVVLPQSDPCRITAQHTSPNNCSASWQQTCSYKCSTACTCSSFSPTQCFSYSTTVGQECLDTCTNGMCTVWCQSSGEGTVDSNSDASQLTGTSLITQYDAAGKVACRGSYDWTATRVHQ